MNTYISITLIAVFLNSFAFSMKKDTNRERTEKANRIIALIREQNDKEAKRKQREDNRMADIFSIDLPSAIPTSPTIDFTSAPEPDIDPYTNPRHATYAAKLKAIEEIRKLTEKAIQTTKEEIEDYQRDQKNIFQGGGIIDLTSSLDRNPECTAYHQEATEYYRIHDNIFAKLDAGRPKTTLS